MHTHDRAAWMMLRTGEDNEQTRRNDQIAEGNREREQERAAGHEAIRTIQAHIRDIIRHVAEKAVSFWLTGRPFWSLEESMEFA